MGSAIGAAIGAGSGLLTNLGNTSLNASQIAEQYAMEKRAQADQEAQLADQLTQQAQLNPLRDQAIYNMANILGASPAAFNPTSFLTPTNSGQQGVGGSNLNAVAAANAAYTPGAGGVTGNTQQMILNRLGYGNVGTGTLYDSSLTPPDVLTSSPTAVSTTGGTAPGGQGVIGGNNSGVNPGITAGALQNPSASGTAPTAAQLAQENAKVPPWAQGQMGLPSPSASTAAMAPATGLSSAPTSTASAAAPMAAATSPSAASVNAALMAKLAPQSSTAGSTTGGLSAAQLAQQKLMAQQMGLMGSLSGS